MNRFIPDSLGEALLRPFAMAAPNGWVYIEVIAPDLRFLFLALLLLLSLAFAWKTRRVQPVAWKLAGFLAIAFVPWLVTTGNGRYFIPLLMLSGILCVALVHAMPVTRTLRLTLAVLMIVMQGYAVQQNNPWTPWNAWGLHEWREPPYYPVALDAEARERPATYVTVSTITYSLLAPRFHKDSRWVNVASLSAVDEDSPDVRRAHAIIASAERLRLLMPATPANATADGMPTREARLHMGRFLQLHQLAFAQAEGGCRLLPLRADEALRGETPVEKREKQAAGQAGFWVCEARFTPRVRRPEDSAPAGPLQVRAVGALHALERSCPRLFPPGQRKLIPIPTGFLRHYAGADMKVYVFADGNVYYKYHRALNFVQVGTVDQLLEKGWTMPCDQVPGRSGLPWDRGL